MNTRTTHTLQQGFTVVEVIVTVAVVSLLLTAFFQAIILLESQRVLVAQQARASDVAFSNLRKFPSVPAGLTCQATSMDLTTGGTASQPNRGKAGVPLTFSPETNVQTLGASSTQSVVAYAPNGCDSGGDFNEPKVVKIVSTVTYGPNDEKVSHATYVK